MCAKAYAAAGGTSTRQTALTRRHGPASTNQRAGRPGMSYLLARLRFVLADANEYHGMRLIVGNHGGGVSIDLASRGDFCNGGVCPIMSTAIDRRRRHPR